MTWPADPATPAAPVPWALPPFPAETEMMPVPATADWV